MTLLTSLCIALFRGVHLLHFAYILSESFCLYHVPSVQHIEKNQPGSAWAIHLNSRTAERTELPECCLWVNFVPKWPYVPHLSSQPGNKALEERCLRTVFLSQAEDLDCPWQESPPWAPGLWICELGPHVQGGRYWYLGWLVLHRGSVGQRGGAEVDRDYFQVTFLLFLLSLLIFI